MNLTPIRSVLTGILFLAPPQQPAKVFATIPDAVAWLIPHVRTVCGAATTPEEVIAAVEQLCTSFRARPVKGLPAP